MAPKGSVLPPSSLAEVIGYITVLSPEEFDVLKQAVSSEKSFSLSDLELDRISEVTGLARTTMSYLLTALAFIYDQLDQHNEQLFLREEKILSVAKELKLTGDGGNEKDLLSRLSSLLAHNEANVRFRKAKRLYDGFIPNYAAASTFLDIRPSFSEDRSSVDGYLPLVQLRIVTDSSKEIDRSFTLQLSAESVSALIKVLSDADAKMKTVKSLPVFENSIIEVN